MKKTLQIVIVTDTYAPEINGVSTTLARWIDHLCGTGHEVTLMMPFRSDREPPPGSTVQNVSAVRVPGYRALRMGFTTPWALEHRWNIGAPDVLYVATEGPLGWAALSAAERLGIPVVTGYHTRFASYSQHYGTKALAPLVRTFLRHFHNRSDYTLVPTEALRLELLAEGYQRVGVIGRGVDTALYSPARGRSIDAERTRRGPRVLYAGRLAAEKNLPLAVQAFEAVRARHPHAEFVLAGDGPLRAGLEDAHPDYHFRGSLSSEELALEYARADFCLFPSLTETFGNVVLEAMASGTPVVAFDQAAAALYIRNGLDGLLAAPGASEIFVGHAVRLANERFGAAAMGALARQSVRGLDWAGVSRQFELCLYEAIDAARASRSPGHTSA